MKEKEKEKEEEIIDWGRELSRKDRARIVRVSGEKRQKTMRSMSSVRIRKSIPTPTATITWIA
eukprot:1342413-Amorphochlora_amoeboformis.AAC.1